MQRHRFFAPASQTAAALLRMEQLGQGSYSCRVLEGIRREGGQTVVRGQKSGVSNQSSVIRLNEIQRRRRWEPFPLLHPQLRHKAQTTMLISSSGYTTTAKSTAEPRVCWLVNHPIAVAEVLARVGGVTNAAMLQAAILHDTIEDTQTTPQELGEQFGQEVQLLVQELTDDKSLPKEERKRLQIEHAAHSSAGAKQIKLADKICNLLDITPAQPVDWPMQRKLDYLDWAQRVVAGCRGSNIELEQHFDAVLGRKATDACAGLADTGCTPGAVGL